MRQVFENIQPDRRYRLVEEDPASIAVHSTTGKLEIIASNENSVSKTSPPGFKAAANLAVYPRIPMPRLEMFGPENHLFDLEVDAGTSKLLVVCDIDDNRTTQLLRRLSDHRGILESHDVECLILLVSKSHSRVTDARAIDFIERESPPFAWAIASTSGKQQLDECLGDWFSCPQQSDPIFGLLLDNNGCVCHYYRGHEFDIADLENHFRLSRYPDDSWRTLASPFPDVGSENTGMQNSIDYEFDFVTSVGD